MEIAFSAGRHLPRRSNASKRRSRRHRAGRTRGGAGRNQYRWSVLKRRGLTDSPQLEVEFSVNDLPVEVREAAVRESIGAELDLCCVGNFLTLRL